MLGKSDQIGVPLRVHSLVVAETVWVLQSFYGYSKSEISGTLIPPLEQPALKVEGARTVIRALERMAECNADFADALLAGTARSHGKGVVSFEKDFRKLDIEWRDPS